MKQIRRCTTRTKRTRRCDARSPPRRTRRTQSLRASATPPSRRGAARATPARRRRPGALNDRSPPASCRESAVHRPNDRAPADGQTRARSARARPPVDGLVVLRRVGHQPDVEGHAGPPRVGCGGPRRRRPRLRRPLATPRAPAPCPSRPPAHRRPSSPIPALTSARQFVQLRSRRARRPLPRHRMRACCRFRALKTRPSPCGRCSPWDSINPPVRTLVRKSCGSVGAVHAARVARVYDELTSFEVSSSSDQGHKVGAFTARQPQAEPTISRGWR